MPVNTSRIHRNKLKGDDGNGDKKKKANNKSQKPTFRKAFRGTLLEDNKSPDVDQKKHDEKLILELSECLEECSQQRLRALHMSLRLYGNDESKISNKELVQSFQENGVSIPSALLRSLTAMFETPQGVDLEGTHRFLTDAHGRTGRDSVMAMHQRNDLIARPEVSQEEVDEDLLWRIESQLIKTLDYVDIAGLRTEFQNRDVGGTSRLDFNLMKQICGDRGVPIFGALLKNVLKRFAERKNNESVRWSDFLSFLEKAQQNAWASCPSLKEIPEKAKVKAPVAPSPIDELSARARTVLVNKLRKKSSIKKQEMNSKADEKITTDENQNKTIKNDTEDSASVMPTPETTASQKTTSKTDTDDKQATAQTTTTGDNSSKKLQIDKGENLNKTDTVDNKPDNKRTEKNNETSDTAAKSDAKETRTTDERDTTKSAANKPKAEHERTNTETKTEVGDNTQKTEAEAEVAEDTHKKTRFSVDEETNNVSEDDNPKTKAKRDSIHVVVPVAITIEQPSRDNTPLKKPDTAAIDPQPDNREKDNAEDENGKGKDNEDPPGDTEKEFTTNTRDSSGKEDGEVIPMESTATMVGTEKMEVKVRGNTLQFDVEKGYMDKQKIDAPVERLRLEWVYGYRGNDCRKNIHILATGEIIYFISYIAIIHSRNTNKQRHYREHTDDIKCIDIHSKKVIVATGQYANRRNATIQAHIRVWRSDTLQTMHVLGMGQFEKAVVCVAFASGKDMLAAVDNSLDKKLTVWDTATGELKGERLLHSDLICDIGFNYRHSDTLVTIGKEHLFWWKVTQDTKEIQAGDKPDYGGFLKAKFVICMTFTERGDLITGDSNGTIYIFGNGGNKITNYIKHAHDGPVFTVLYHRGQILSGGRDGIIHCWQWSKNMDSTGFVQLPKTEGGIRMLRVSEWKLLVGTTMNSILVVNMADGDAPLNKSHVEANPLTQCHYDDLRGLTTISNARTDVITAGLDGIVCGFQSGNHRSVFKFQNKGNQYLCVDCNDSGTILALGTKDGHLLILEHTCGTWTESVDRKLCRDRIDCIKISPDCMSVAAGSRDSCIYIYTNQQQEDNTFAWEYAGCLKGHTGAITSIDWSSHKVEEGFILRSCSTTLQLKYWLPDTGHEYEKPVTLTPKDWGSFNALVDPSTVGILTTQITGDTEVLSICRNNKLTLAGMGDNSGHIHLYKVPCSLNGVFCHSYKDHATVYCVRFTPCGKRLMTVGGRDSCLMQWEII